MIFHHIGVATKNIGKTVEWIKNSFDVISISEKIFDKNQNATLQMVKTKDLNIEVVTGKIVERLLEKGINYYHICYEVDSLEDGIKSLKGMPISVPKEALLFDNRRVVFINTPLGIVELLEKE